MKTYKLIILSLVGLDLINFAIHLGDITNPLDNFILSLLAVFLMIFGVWIFITPLAYIVFEWLKKD